MAFIIARYESVGTRALNLVLGKGNRLGFVQDVAGDGHIPGGGDSKGGAIIDCGLALSWAFQCGNVAVDV